MKYLGSGFFVIATMVCALTIAIAKEGDHLGRYEWSVPYLITVIAICVVLGGVLLFVSRPEKTPVSLHVELMELVHKAIDKNNNDSGCDIFVLVRAELLSPLKTRILPPRLELLLHGNSEVATLVPDDLDQWQGQIWGSTDIIKHTMSPLTPKMKKGEPAEGWIHFVTQVPYRDIERYSLRLILETPDGSGYADGVPENKIWESRKRIVTKNKL
jgi:hypothetical protein